MPIIKLSAIDSTNTFLRQMSSNKRVENYTIVVAESQLQGRGQMGTSWQSQAGKNLMASVFVDVSFLSLERSFWISMATSLALAQVLKGFEIPKVTIKWPNDILADQKKISGILIENVIKNNGLQATIIGVGLNVNQVYFDNLPLATSMQIVSGKAYNINVIVELFLEQLKQYIHLLKEDRFDDVKELYETELFRKGKPSTFRDAKGVLFSGFIKGVTNSGHLKVLIEDDKIKVFDLKEIQLLY